MNLGARNADETAYQTDKAIDATKADVSETADDMAKRAVTDALEWIDGRGNAGDNIPTQSVHALHQALHTGDYDHAVRHALEVSGAQMHPTANDIVGGAARQAVYSLTGKRAHTFEVDNE